MPVSAAAPTSPDTDQIIIEEERIRENYTRMPNTVLRRADISTGAKLTYMMLLSYAHHQNFCFPGQARLASDLGVGERSVVRYIQELVTSGLLRVKRRGLGRTNVYTLAKWVDTPGEAESHRETTRKLEEQPELRTAILADQETPEQAPEPARSANLASPETPAEAFLEVPNWQVKKIPGEEDPGENRDVQLRDLRALARRVSDRYRPKTPFTKLLDVFLAMSGDVPRLAAVIRSRLAALAPEYTTQQEFLDAVLHELDRNGGIAPVS